MEEPLSLLLVGAHHPDNYGLVVSELLPRLNDAFGGVVAAGDASEDVDEKCFDAVVL